jgi:hypothetical protein
MPRHALIRVLGQDDLRSGLDQIVARSFLCRCGWPAGAAATYTAQELL